jgi:hypothetical protein
VYTKSGLLSALPDALMDAFVEHAAAAPPGEDVFSIWAFGGALGRVPEEATAFAGRSAPVWIGAESMWDDPAQDRAHREWARSAIDLIEPYRLTGRYERRHRGGRRGGRPERVRRREVRPARGACAPGIRTTSSG